MLPLQIRLTILLITYRTQVNPLTEILFDDARAQAKELDSFLEKTGKRVGPLHGLPISIKEQFAVKGYDTTIGYVSYIGKKAGKDSILGES